MAHNQQDYCRWRERVEIHGSSRLFIGMPAVAGWLLCVGFTTRLVWLLTGEATRTPRVCSPNTPASSPSQLEMQCALQP